MADHEASSRAAEAAVGEQGHGLAESFAHDRRRDAQHLTHTWAPFRAFVTDHDYVARLDLLVRDGGHCVFFRLEDAGRTTVRGAFVPADLYHAAFGCDVAMQDHQA